MKRNQPRQDSATGGRNYLTIVAVALTGVVILVILLHQLLKNRSSTDAPLPGGPQESMLARYEGLRRGDQFEAAHALIAEHLKNHPDDAEARPRLAQSLLDLGRLDKVELAINDVLKSPPRSAEGLWLTGELIGRRGDPNATRYYRLAALSADAKPDIWRRYGLRMLEQSSGQDEDAAAFLRKAFQAGLKDHVMCQRLGRFEYQRARYRPTAKLLAEAAELLAEAVKLDANDPEDWSLLASCMVDMGNLDAAAGSLREGLKFAHGADHPKLLMQLAEVFLKQQRKQDAAETFAKAAMYPGAAAGASLRAAQCCYDLQQYGRAMEHIDRAAALQPSDPETLSWRSRIEDARFVRQGSAPAPSSRPPGA
jgi:tetratricopeptide (TPR) repeat protein